MATTPATSEGEAERDTINRAGSFEGFDDVEVSEDDLYSSASEYSRPNRLKRTQRTRKPIPAQWEPQDEQTDNITEGRAPLDVSQLLSTLRSKDYLNRKGIKTKILNHHFTSQNRNTFTDLSSLSLKEEVPQPNRDWNTRFVEILDGSTASPQDSRQRFQRLEIFTRLFEDRASNIAVQVVNEAVSNGTLKNEPVVIEGILVEFLCDEEGEEERKMLKWWNHEMRIKSTLLNLCIDKLYFPLSALVSYLGFTLRLSCLAPIATNEKNEKGEVITKSGTTIQSVDIITESPIYNAATEMMTNACHLLHLGCHSVAVPSKLGLKRRKIYGSFHTEVHQGTDGRLYVLKVHGLSPPLACGQDVDVICHRFRPEYLLDSSSTLSSDAFSSVQSQNNGEGEKHDEGVREASNHLQSHTLTEYVQFADQQYKYRADVQMRSVNTQEKGHSLSDAAEEITRDMHARGINLFFLGVVVEQSTTFVKNMACTLIASRVIKNIIFSRLRRAFLSDRQTIQKKDWKQVIVENYNKIFITNDVEMREEIKKGSRYYRLSDEIIQSLFEKIHLSLLFTLLSKSMNIEWNVRRSSLYTTEEGEPFEREFLLEDIIQLKPILKTMRPLSQGRFASRQRCLMGMTESSHCLRTALLSTQPHQVERVMILQQLGYLYSSDPRNSSHIAQQYYQEMMSIIQKQSGNYAGVAIEEPIQIVSLLSVSDHFFSLSKFREAETFLTRAREIAEKFASNSVNGGTTAVSLSGGQSSKSRSGASTPGGGGSITGIQSAGPENTLRLQLHGLVMSKMAKLKRLFGDYKNAESYFLSAAKRFVSAGAGLVRGAEGEISQSSEPIECSQFFSSLAMIHYEMGRVEDCEKLLRRAVEMSEKSFGIQHHKVTGSLYDLGFFLIRLGRYNEAESILRRSLVSREMLASNVASTQVSYHSLLAQNLHALAIISSSRYNYDEALASYAKAYEVLTERYSGVSVEASTTKRKHEWIQLIKSVHRSHQTQLNDLTLSVHDLSDRRTPRRRTNSVTSKKLTDEEETNVESFLSLYFAQQIDVGSIFDELSVNYYKLAALEKSDSAQLRAISFRENSIFYNRDDVATTLMHMAELEFAKGNHSKARDILQRIVQTNFEYYNCADGFNVSTAASDVDRLFIGPLRRLASQIAAVEYDLAQVDYRTGESKRALERFDRSRSIIDDLSPTDSTFDAALRIHGVAYLYTTRGDYDVGKEKYKIALDVLVKLFGENHPEVASVKNNLAWLYFKMGMLVEAEELYGQSLAIRRKVLGDEHPEVARSLHEAAELYTVQGKFNESEQYNRRALQIREKVLGKNHVDVARSKHNMASLCLAQGKYNEAETLMNSSIEILIKALNDSHPKLGTSYLQLGKIYYRQGRHEEAEKIYNKALNILRSQFNGDHPDTAATLHSLGYLYATRGDYNRAEELYRQSRDMTEHCFGSNHPETAQSWNNLAWIYFRQSKYDESRDLYEKSLQLWERILGPEHIQVARGLNDLAELYTKLGKIAEARPLNERALTIRKKILGNNHPDVAKTLSQKGELLLAQGQYVEAERCQREALQIVVSKLGENHPKVAEVLHLLAKLYHKQGKMTNSEGLYVQSLKMRENSLGREHPDTATSMEDLAYLWTSQAKYTNALELYGKARNIIEKTYGQEHPQVAVIKSNIAWIYFKQGLYKEAESLYQQALAVREETFGQNHPEVARSCYDLAELYLRTGRFSEAETFNDRSHAIRSSIYSSDHSDVNRTVSQKAILYYYKGRYEEAEKLQSEALKNLVGKLGENHSKVASAMHELAKIHFKQGKYDEAENELKKTLTIRKKVYGEEAKHPEIAESYSTMGYLFGTLGMYKSSMEHYRKALIILAYVFGSDQHPEVISLESCLAWISFKQAEERAGNYDEAEEKYKKCMAYREKLLGENHPEVARSCHELSELYRKKGMMVEAEEYSMRSLDIREKTLGPNHVDVARALESLAEIHTEKGDDKGAEEHLKRSLDILTSQLGPNHIKVAQAEQSMGKLLENRGKYQAAETHYRNALAIRKLALGNSHPSIAESLHALANVCNLLKRTREAETLYEESIAVLKGRLGTNHPDVAALMTDYEDFLQHEESEEEKKKAAPSPGGGFIGGWGSVIAVGLMSTAVYAMQKLSNK
ncbi:Tfp pilus assembly protein PilF [Planoprotostelium fungivorum]|uniref:Tfp pilus assembly protein PilF n=1 Tax=Planoprotostelium fungivorum TaxID=1890364 RepID=A0A2P6MXS9_9EUKA|nr:Tfp pilus assembly protein PilF [Planoprotostelium fungivorum]